MKRYWALSLILILCLLSGCADPPGQQSAAVDPETPPPVISSSSHDIEAEAHTAPAWVVWLSEKWDEDATVWMNYAEAENKNIQLWLRDHPEYGEMSKCWSLHSSLQKLGVISVTAHGASLKDAALRNKAVEDLSKELLSEWSARNDQFTFQFVDYKNLSASVDWNSELSVWICTLNADISYDGVILPYGSIQPSHYINLPLGVFELSSSDDAYSLIPLYPDSLDRMTVYSTPIGNTNLYVYVDDMVLSDTVPAIEDPEVAATVLAEMYLEDMMTVSDERTFTITKYRNLNVHLYPTIGMDEDTAAIYLLQPFEIRKNTWIMEIDVMFQYQGALSPVGSMEGQWIDVLYQASPIGFLLTKDGTEYTLQSRYYTANGN